MKYQLDIEGLTDNHSFINDKIFRLKTYAHTFIRFLRNCQNPVSRFSKYKNLLDAPVSAYSESALWNPNDNNENWILTAGKIENLRIAANRLDGLEVKADQVFSFWKHIGNPNFGKGYKIGREIREGCIVPTIAGGLCQLSNALYSTALDSGFEILERHRHTKVIEGSLAEKDRDATVKWNYVDLRFKSKADFRIETRLDSEKLIVKIKSHQKSLGLLSNTSSPQSPHTMNDCLSCGNISCDIHPRNRETKNEKAITTYILDNRWPEYDKYIESIKSENDCFIIPLNSNALFNTKRYAWKAIGSNNFRTTPIQAAYRAIRLRRALKKKQNVFDLNLHLDRQLSRAAVKRIPINTKHIVVSQNLLPFVYESGALGGRTYDVLMTRLPINHIHSRLDFAQKVHPDSRTLSDFRASEELSEMEEEALDSANKIISPHSEISNIYRDKSILLDWEMPSTMRRDNKGSQILFPASLVGRKGASEYLRLAEEMGFDITISGRVLEFNSHIKNHSVNYFDGDWSKIYLVVFPTYIEHQPRTVLKALSYGIPVIASDACGIEPRSGLTLIKTGDYDQLKKAFMKITDST